MMKNRSKLVPICLAVACLFSSSAAFGQTPPPDLAAAEALFQEGMQLLLAGKADLACPKLEESVRIDRAMGAVLNLASCYEDIGKTASAWALFIEAEAAFRKRNDERAETAKQRAEALMPKLSRLVIEVPQAARAEGLVVHRDETEIGQGQWGVAVPVDPGKHIIEVTAPGKVASKREVVIEAKPSETRLVIDPLVDEPAKTSPGQAVSPKSSAQRNAGIAVTGVGVAGLVAGFVLGGVASGKKGEMDTNCIQTDPPQCNAAGIGLASDVKTLGTASTAVLIAGGLLTAGGVVIWLTAPASAPPASAPSATKRTGVRDLSVALGPSGAILRGAF